MTENEIAKQILTAAFVVHTRLGPGLLESVYEVVLAYELEKGCLTAERQKPMPILYDNIRFDEAFRSDWKCTCSSRRAPKCFALRGLNLAPSRTHTLVRFASGCPARCR